MIERNITVCYGDTDGYVKLATTLERLTRSNFAEGPVGHSVRDNKDGTAVVTVSGKPDMVDTIIRYISRNFR